MTDEDDDFDLNELDDAELVEQMHDDLYDGLKDEIVEGTEILLSEAGVRTESLMTRSSAVCKSSASILEMGSYSSRRFCSRLTL